jgi:hypothetical protein
MEQLNAQDKALIQYLAKHKELLFKILGDVDPIVEPKEVVNEVEQERWKPKYDEIYWYVPSDLIVGSICNKNDSIDKSIIKSGNCFKTEQEAQQKANQIKELLSKK